jgi:hypothetical protein
MPVASWVARRRLSGIRLTDGGRTGGRLVETEIQQMLIQGMAAATAAAAAEEEDEDEEDRCITGQLQRQIGLRASQGGRVGL